MKSGSVPRMGYLNGMGGSLTTIGFVGSGGVPSSLSLLTVGLGGGGCSPALKPSAADSSSSSTNANEDAIG
jgi:hypothetical protein